MLKLLKKQITKILIILLCSLCYAGIPHYGENTPHNFLLLQPVQENKKLNLSNCSIDIKIEEGESAYINCTTTYTIDSKSNTINLDFILYDVPARIPKVEHMGMCISETSWICYYKINNGQRINLKMSPEYEYSVTNWDIEKKGRPYYGFKAKLKKGINVISVTSVYKVLSTWPEGFYFALDFTEPMHWNLEKFEGCKITIDRPNEYLQICNLPNIEILGDGKNKDDIYYMRSGILKAELSDFPDGLVEIELLGVKSGSCFIPETFDSSNLKDADDYFKLCYWLIRNYYAPYLIPGNFDRTVSIFEKLNKTQLRYLRNSFYAVYGYIFNSSELNDFFDQSLSRVKDPSVTEESIFEKDRLYPECFTLLIETITGIENGENPREFFYKTIHKYFTDEDMIYEA